MSNYIADENGYLIKHADHDQSTHGRGGGGSSGGGGGDKPSLKALRSSEKALSLSKSSPPYEDRFGSKKKAVDLGQKALSQSRKGQKEKKARHYKQAADIHKAAANEHKNIARALEGRGKMNDALPHAIASHAHSKAASSNKNVHDIIVRLAIEVESSD